jgi:hypothetical protein
MYLLVRYLRRMIFVHIPRHSGRLIQLQPDAINQLDDRGYRGKWVKRRYLNSYRTYGHVISVNVIRSEIRGDLTPVDKRKERQ